MSNVRDESGVAAQYTTGLCRDNVERALIAAGLRLDRLRPDDLAMLEDFHTMGRLGTALLTELLAISDGDEVLDAGSGIGGTARFLAAKSGCRVAAVDLTEEYCETARWLNGLVGLADRIDVRAGDVTRLPFPDNMFQVVVSQHVQMNVADKAGLYREAHRVLAPGGRLGIWDVVATGSDVPTFPVPWADRPELSHLVPADELRRAVEAAGFTVTHWADLTEQAGTVMRQFRAQPPGPLGLHVFVDDFQRKADNLVQSMADGRLRVVQAVATA